MNCYKSHKTRYDFHLKVIMYFPCCAVHLISPDFNYLFNILLLIQLFISMNMLLEYFRITISTNHSLHFT